VVDCPAMTRGNLLVLAVWLGCACEISGSPENGEPSEVAGSAGRDGSELGGAGEQGGAGGAGPEFWQPSRGLSWQWELSTTVGEPLPVDVYDIDWESEPAVIERLHAAGIKVICYVSVGSWEDWRSDGDALPPEVIGLPYDGWEGEYYLDIRSAEVRALMEQRFEACRAIGCDAIEPDNMDVFELGQESGFPLTEQDGLDYAHFLAEAAHSRGLGIGQKNAAGLTEQLLSSYQWVLTEDCFADGDWCGEVMAYAQAGKPVFLCEYQLESFDEACRSYLPEGASPILKSLELDAEITFCDGS